MDLFQGHFYNVNSKSLKDGVGHTFNQPNHNGISDSGGIVYTNQNRLPGLWNETKSSILYACSVHWKLFAGVHEQ